LLSHPTFSPGPAITGSIQPWPGPERIQILQRHPTDMRPT
jgi:hypothetical protein